jgi:glycosyltransferase involved in cell wall biosynthesis
VIGLYHDGYSYEVDQGVKVYRLPRRFRLRKGSGLLDRVVLTAAVARLVRASGVDLLEVPDWGGMLLPYHFGIPKIVRLCGSHLFYSRIPGQPMKLSTVFFECLNLWTASSWVAISEVVADTTKRVVRFGPRPVAVIHNFVDTEKFTPGRNNTEGNRIILYTGSLLPKKGIMQLVQSLPEVLRRFPDVAFKAVGKDSRDPVTGESMTEHLLMSLPHDVRPQVSFLGVRPHSEMPMHYQQATVCAMPSLQEAFGLMWLEAMACGKPTIASKTGAGPELIEDGVSGLLCNPYDRADIARKLIYLLENGDVRERLGKSARERVVQRFSPSVIVEKNLDLYARWIQAGR